MRKLVFNFALILLPSLAFADDFVYRCFGNLPVISSTLNAIAMITNSSQYGRLLQFVMLVGMVLATVYSIYAKRYDVIKYPAVTLLILGLFFWSKTSVTIYDETFDEYDVVDNVPIGFAYGATTVSGIGYYFTKIYEQAFAIPTTTILFSEPNDVVEALQYSKIGLGGAFQSLNEIQSFSLSYKVNSEFQDYYENCLSYEMLASTNSQLETFFKNKYFVDSDGNLNCDRFPNGLGTRWTLPTTIGGVDTTCQEACENILAPDIYDFMDNYYNKYFSEPRLASKVTSLDNVLTTLTNDSYTMKQALLQNALIKATFQNIVNGNVDAGVDPYKFTGIMSFLQANEQGKSLVYYASEYIPAYRNVMEAIMIAVFPIIVIMFIFPRGWMFIKGYILSLFWIQLWHPIASVMNSILVIMALKKSAMISNLVGAGYSPMTATLYSQYAGSMIGVTGFMMMSIPAIATIVVYGGNWVAGRIADGMARTAMATAGAVYSPEMTRKWLRENVTADMLGDPQVDKQTRLFNTARYEAFQDIGLKSAQMMSYDNLGITTGKGVFGVADTISKGSLTRSYINSVETQRVVDKFGMEGTIDAKAYGELAQLKQFDYSKQHISWDKLGTAQGMNTVKDAISTLDSPKQVREALNWTANTYEKYADILRQQGDYRNAQRFEMAAEMMRASSKLNDQEMLNRVETLKKAGAFAPILSYDATSKATDGAGYIKQHAVIDANKGTYEQRMTEEQLGKFISMSSKQWIESGKMSAAERKALVEDFNPQRWEEIKHWQNTLLNGEIKGREQFWGSRSAYQKAVISESLIREAMMSGRIKGFDLNGDGKLTAAEAKATAQEYAQMTTLMNRAEAGEFWKTFEKDPEKALESLRMKYGETYQGMKAFAALANERGITPEKLGQIFANKKYFEASYNEGYYMLLRDMAKELGISEAALRGSDPRMTAIKHYAKELYSGLREGYLTEKQLNSNMHDFGLSRAYALAAFGVRGELATMGLKTDKLLSDKEIDKLRNIYEKIPGLSDKIDDIMPAKSIKTGNSSYFDSSGKAINPKNIITKTDTFDPNSFFVEKTDDGFKVYSNYFGKKGYVTQSLVNNMVFAKDEKGNIKVIGLINRSNQLDTGYHNPSIKPDFKPKWIQ
ncbi:conjugal transfer protein TraG [Deferribacter autotrophicus]|uniref:Conjugal transfer protein TraG n=1 Tax=Deferribacter autotrophicus TaxID=500465 RepID=A0A5A8F1C0_9BACT|nr:conjugal transfer protein TraG N-terminal domain-containing protein [Deferribacter autotrophicus]KAA0257482.1 conjugal transfer protein TraG [Deferribacter autotrophicus]